MAHHRERLARVEGQVLLGWRDVPVDNSLVGDSARATQPVFAKLLAFENIQRSVDLRGRRQALLDAGAPLTKETMGMREPRRGMMRL